MKLNTRKKNEKRFLELMKSAADQSANALSITTAKFNNYDTTHPKIVYINNAFSNMTGYSPKEILGKSPWILQGPKTDPNVIVRLKENVSAGQNFHGESIFYRKDQSEFAMEWDASAVLNSQGNMTHFVSIQRDVSRQVSDEKAKEERIGIVSHELKNPLTAIRGFVEILKNRLRTSLDTKSREYFAIIDTEVEKIMALSAELQETIKIQAEGVQLNKDFCNLDEVIRQVIKNIKVTTITYKIRRRGKVGGLIHCDKDRIAQVLTNLLTNATQYSKDDTQIFVRVKKDKFHVTISIQDFGMGIPSDKLEAVFQRINNQTNKRKSVNSGLGLYTASEIVRNHGGSIWVDSTEGKGSTFSFNIPLGIM